MALISNAKIFADEIGLLAPLIVPTRSPAGEFEGILEMKICIVNRVSKHMRSS